LQQVPAQKVLNVHVQEVAGIRDLVAQWLKMVEFFEKASKLKRLN